MQSEKWECPQCGRAYEDEAGSSVSSMKRRGPNGEVGCADDSCPVHYLERRGFVQRVAALSDSELLDQLERLNPATLDDALGELYTVSTQGTDLHYAAEQGWLPPEITQPNRFRDAIRAALRFEDLCKRNSRHPSDCENCSDAHTTTLVYRAGTLWEEEVQMCERCAEYSLTRHPQWWTRKAKGPVVVVYISGGAYQGAKASDPLTEVIVYDHDNIDDGDPAPEVPDGLTDLL